MTFGNRILMDRIIRFCVTVFCVFPFPLLGDFPTYGSNPYTFPVTGTMYRFGDHFFVADVDDDTLPDFIYRTETDLYVYNHDGSLRWTAAIVLPEQTSGNSFGVGDLDGDGQVEIAAVNRSNQVVVYDASSGALERTVSITLPAGTTKRAAYLSVANLRGLGDRDLIVQTADITLEGSGREYYINRRLIALNMFVDRVDTMWSVEQNNTFDIDGIYYEGYWGQAHGGLRVADVDADGKDEVLGGTLVDNDGTLIWLGYSQDWVYKGTDYIDHLDAVIVGDFRPDLPGLEWAVCEDDFAPNRPKTDPNINLNNWNTSLLRKIAGSGIVWRVETTLFVDDSRREPTELAVGNFDTSRAYAEVWVRSTFCDDDIRGIPQHPWVFDANGFQFSDYESKDPDGNKKGIESVWTIDWKGSKKEYICGQTRLMFGAVGVFDPITGNVVWHSQSVDSSIEAHTFYVADIAGDSREEIIIYDRADGKIKVFSNDEPNPNQSKPNKWDDPLYQRVKQNWNHGTTGSYTSVTYPVIGSVAAVNVTTTSATITWTTDEFSDTQVDYGLTSSYGSQTTRNTTKVFSHSVLLSGLTQNTEYHFRVRSINDYNQPGLSRDYAFTTDGLKRLEFGNSAHTFYSGVVSPPLIVEVRDKSTGVLRNLASNTTFLLQSNSTNGQFSADPFHWNSISQVVVPAGSCSTVFYYRDNSVGSPRMIVSESPDASWTDATQIESVLGSGSFHVSHIVYGTVRTLEGVMPDPDDLDITACIKVRPTDTLTENAAACGYNGEYWWIECANFTAGWSSGEKFRVRFTDAGSGQTGMITVSLNESSSQDAGQVVLGSDPPEIIDIEVVNTDHIRLTWNSESGITGYNVYRGTTAVFVPDTLNGTNRVATGIGDQESGIPDVQWTDPADVVGSAATNYFYVVTAVRGGRESGSSNRVGEFDYALIVTATTDINGIALPLRPLHDYPENARDLRPMVANCDAVLRWDASVQGYDQYIPAVPGTDFSLTIPGPYYVGVTAASVFTMTGEVIEGNYDLVTTTTTDFNEVMLPLNKTGITKASHLKADIPACNGVAWWNAEIQGYRQYVPDLSLSDFDVRVGYPYLVNITSSGSWPYSTPKNFIELVMSFSAPGHSLGPHAVWGECLPSMPPVDFSAFLVSRPTDVLSQSSPGCFIEDGFWFVQCGAFRSGWAVGDTMRVVFLDANNVPIGNKNVVLTCFPSDRADMDGTGRTVSLPLAFRLEPVFPNPFNGTTRIRIALPGRERLVARIFDTLGRTVRTLVDDVRDPGIHELLWDGSDEGNRSLPSGLYLLRVQAGKRHASQKIIVVR